MSDIVARLRDWRSLHLTRLGGLFEEAAAEMERLRLTDAERRDIAIAADAYEYADHDADCARIAATLRGLLERLS